MKKMKMEDGISTLPDALLCHILSFLTTKEAVATSVLSKRWIPLWRSVPTLHFKDANYHTDIGHADHDIVKDVCSRIVQSVYAVILSRDFQLPIKKFYLRLNDVCQPFYDPANVSVWVNAVVQRQLEHLDISLPYPMLSTPRANLSSIFSCRTLVVLKLRGGLELKRFPSVHFPCLKVLHLQGALLLHDVPYLAELLSGCPVLENLKQSLIFYQEYVPLTNREFNTLPKLVRADISETIFRMNMFNNVHFLRIDEICEGLLRGGECMFYNLTHIELVYANYNYDWFEVVKFLKYCPKLQVLVINQPDFYDYDLDQLHISDWQDPPSVPKCILLHLKVCYLNDYRGTKGELQFARYIMRHGRFLKRMTISSSTAENQRGKLKNVKKLFSCTRRSATCKFSFK
ncbi:FBD-associated F-box protein At5g56370-like [Lotus japonicus]|uniref:FBD-associated F-box protein At5g56370-like n=1 Tax=Lotus japonicus TaxID=34305 RepID=UPI00258CE2B5|nr:FBD-associated F-box protein At5g56370-like [Lotus japonicus]